MPPPATTTRCAMSIPFQIRLQPAGCDFNSIASPQPL
jgi:hypothetical protein